MPFDFTYMWNLKNKVNTQTRKRLTDTENILKVARWERGWETSKKGKGLRSTDW